VNKSLKNMAFSINQDILFELSIQNRFTIVKFSSDQPAQNSTQQPSKQVSALLDFFFEFRLMM